MKKDDAVEALEKAGLILGNIGIVVSDGDKGTVRALRRFNNISRRA